MSLERKCPNCINLIRYSNKQNYQKANKKNSFCKDCCYLAKNGGLELQKNIKQLHDLGLKNREIARDLKISHARVAYHLKLLNLVSNGISTAYIEQLNNQFARCQRCKKIKSLNEFQYGRRGQKYEYRFSYCNACRNKQTYSNLNSDKYKYLKHRFESIRKRAKNLGIDFNLEFDYIKNLFDKQNGKCFYSDLLLNTKVNTAKEQKINSVSFDKIDPSKGYTKGNVVLCSNRINSIKRDISLEEMKQWMPEWYRRVMIFKEEIKEIKHAPKTE
jgi:hypothetical protein